MAAKALLCKIKIDVWRKKKKQWVKNDLSVSSHLQQYRRWPHHSLCSGREWAPRLSQRLGLKVSMDLWTYPMIIPQAVSYVCACVCVFGGGIPTWERQSKTRWMMRGMRSKKLAGLEGTDHKISMQVICFEIHLHDSCPWLSSPCCSLLSKNLLV